MLKTIVNLSVTEAPVSHPAEAEGGDRGGSSEVTVICIEDSAERFDDEERTNLSNLYSYIPATSRNANRY